MMCVSLLSLLGMILRCKGQSLTVTPEKYYVLKGEDVEIKWIISGIEVSALGSRVWRKLPVTTLATIRGDEKENKINNTILGEGFDVKKPSTLILKNVTEDFDGDYRFNIISKDSIVFLDSDVTVVFLNPPQETKLNFNYTTRTITCEAYGHPPPTLEIFHDGKSVSTNNTYIIPELNDDSYTGNYTCVAKNLLGMVSSPPKPISPVAKPIIAVSCSSPTTMVEGDYFTCECKGTGGNPPADVTWYKNNTKIGVTGKEKASFSLSDVDKDDNGTYTCEAKSLDKTNKTTVALIVASTPVIQVNCSTCSSTTAVEGDYFACECKGGDGNPPADVTWYKNNTQIVKGKEKAILRFTNVHKDNSGKYRCEATSHEKAKNETSIEFIVTNKACPDNMPSGTEWYIIVVTLVCGIIIGVLLSYIVWCSHRRWFRKRKSKRKPDQQPTEADSTYQELDQSKMNQEDNYQSLRGNVARINDVTNDDESTYTELSKTRDVEDNYQSLN